MVALAVVATLEVACLALSRRDGCFRGDGWLRDIVTTEFDMYWSRLRGRSGTVRVNRLADRTGGREALPCPRGTLTILVSDVY